VDSVCELVHHACQIACSEAEDEVTGEDVALQKSKQRVTRRDVMQVNGSRVLRNRIHNNLRRHSWTWRLARGVDPRDDNAVGLAERWSELRAERFRARVSMGLEDTHQSPILPSFARRTNRGCHFGREMREIIDHRHLASSKDFETPRREVRPRQGPGGNGRGDAKLNRRRNSTQRVADVVNARSREQRPPYEAPEDLEKEPRLIARGLCADAANVGISRKACGACCGKAFRDTADPRIIDAQDLPSSPRREIPEGSLELRKCSIGPEMVSVHAGEDGDIRA
jgi:hypothetical protein